MRYTFGSFLKEHRERLDLTQTEFGALVKINTSAISRIENGSQKFASNKLDKLSQLFSIDIQSIKDLYYADKFAYEAINNNCSASVFEVAEKTIQYLRSNTI